MKNKSHNSNLTVMTKQFLVPSWPKILLYLLIGALILMLWNIRALWEQFNDNILEIPQNSTSIYVAKASWLSHTYNTLVNGRLAQIVFWAFAGCAAYVCIWFISNIFFNIRNDIVADEYVHPANYNRAGYWHSVIARKVFLAAVVIIFILSALTALRLMGLLAKFFYASLQGFKLSPDLGKVTLALLGAGFMIYILVLLAHITVNSWRSVYADL